MAELLDGLRRPRPRAAGASLACAGLAPGGLATPLRLEGVPQATSSVDTGVVSIRLRPRWQGRTRGGEGEAKTDLRRSKWEDGAMKASSPFLLHSMALFRAAASCLGPKYKSGGWKRDPVARRYRRSWRQERVSQEVCHVLCHMGRGARAMAGTVWGRSGGQAGIRTLDRG